MNIYFGAYIIGALFGVIGMIVSGMLKRKFNEYSQIPISKRMTGKEVAEKMLHDNDIYDVQVISQKGFLTDHYNPAKKTVNLSEAVYGSDSIAAAAVAAHECGHAVQHATAYSMLQLRSKLVPVVSISSKFVMLVIMAGILMINTFPNLLLVGIILFATTTLFSFVTLPVEFDASRRALVWLETSDMTSRQEHEKAKDALKWAAMTYVVAALGSLATLLYYVMIFMGRRN